MGITFTNFNDGAVMVSTDMEAEFTRARNWLNRGFSASDVNNGTILPEHLYGPESYPWPHSSTEFCQSEIRDYHASISEPIRSTVKDAGALAPFPSPATPGMESIFTENMPSTADGRFNVPKMGCRIALFDSSVTSW